MKKITRLAKALRYAVFAATVLAARDVRASTPKGGLPGAFTVDSTGRKVQFSQGNLQYTYNDGGKWQFAENQYTFVGKANEENIQNKTGVVDLFGYGDIGSREDESSPLAFKTITDDYQGTQFGDRQYAWKEDWGTAAASDIGEGWHTPTSDEWYYLLVQRENAKKLIGFATLQMGGNIGDVKGIILLPDDWSLSPLQLSLADIEDLDDSEITSSSEYNDLGWSSDSRMTFGDNIYDADTWAKMEASGAVFLPAAGYREGTDVDGIGEGGYYRSGTLLAPDGIDAWIAGFEEHSLLARYSVTHHWGFSVRLVMTAYDVTISADTKDVDNWTIAPNPAAEGETVTISYAGTDKIKSVTVKAAMTGKPKKVALGETYYVGEVIAFNAPYPWVCFDDDDEATYTAPLVASDNITITSPAWDSRCSQWKFTNVWKYDFYGFTSNTLRITGTADKQPIGFKCVGGTGTKNAPFTFEGVFDIALSEHADTSYTFVMPASAVTLSVAYYGANDFNADKPSKKEAADLLLFATDTAECTNLVATAKTAIDNLPYDAAKSYDENIAALDAILTKLAEDLKAARIVSVPVNFGDDETITIDVNLGKPYTAEVIAQITSHPQSKAIRHGMAVVGWTNYDGSSVTGDTIVSKSDVLTAVWESGNPLVPETLGVGTIVTAKSQKYEAYILDANGNVKGTAIVFVGKRNKKTGLAAVKTQVKLVGETKTYTFKATEAKGGKAKIDTANATTGIELANKTMGTMVLDIGTEGAYGVWSDTSGNEYEISGVRNTYKTNKALYKAWAGVKTVAIADADGAYSTFSLKIAKSGAVRVKGRLADGTLLSVSTRIMIADDGKEACIAVCGKKKAPVGFTLWLASEDIDAQDNIESITGTILSGDTFAGAAGIDAAKLVLAIGDTEASLVWNGKTLKASDKSAGIAVSYAKSTGVFTGSYKLDTTNAKGKVSKKTVRFAGVFVNGTGYGTTVTNGYAGVGVSILPVVLVD